MLYVSKNLTFTLILFDVLVCAVFHFHGRNFGFNGEKLEWFFYSNKVIYYVIVFTHVQITMTGTEVLKKFCYPSFGPGIYAAHMYFNGYLKLILPQSEYMHHFELAERLKRYEIMQQVKIPIKKLFILFPRSGNTKPLIGKHSDRIEKRQELEPIVMKRAGVGDRRYSNSVYRLFLDEKKTKDVSVCAEFPSPFKNIIDLINDLPELIVFKDAILNTFFERLKELLDSNPECGKYCELVRYDDNVESDVSALIRSVKEHLVYDTRHSKDDVANEFLLENDTNS